MQVIYGIHPVKEAIAHDDEGVRRVVIAMGRRGNTVQELISLAKQKGIPVEMRERAYLDRLAGGQSHQGVVGMCESFTYASMEEVIGNRGISSTHDLILLLDGIQDPRNFGSLIRTAHCFGANGVIIPENRASSVTVTVIKASAGAAYHIPIARVVNVARAIDFLKERGFWIYGASPEGEHIFNTLDYAASIGLLMGSEGGGIRPLLKEKCDFLVSVPMVGEIDSLNVSVAAGILLFEMRKGHIRTGR